MNDDEKWEHPNLGTFQGVGYDAPMWPLYLLFLALAGMFILLVVESTL